MASRLGLFGFAQVDGVLILPEVCLTPLAQLVRSQPVRLSSPGRRVLPRALTVPVR